MSTAASSSMHELGGLQAVLLPSIAWGRASGEDGAPGAQAAHWPVCLSSPTSSAPASATTRRHVVSSALACCV